MGFLTTLLVLFGTIFVIILVGIVVIQRRNKKAVIGKVFCTFFLPHKVRIDTLCRVENKEVFYTTPEGRERTYLIDHNKTATALYPPGQPRLLQAEVQSIVYNSEDPEPIDPYGGDPLISPELLNNLQNEKFSRAMVGEAAREADAGEGLVGGLSKKDYIIILIPAAVGLIALIITYLVYINTNNIASVLGV